MAYKVKEHRKGIYTIYAPDGQWLGNVTEDGDYLWEAVTPTGETIPTGNKVDAVFALIDHGINLFALTQEEFQVIEVFIAQFVTPEDQWLLAQIDEAIEAAKYKEYA